MNTLLVAFKDDPAGHNMAMSLSQDMQKDDLDVFHSQRYDLVVISTPAISADWLEEKYEYDAYVFLSKHAAESGVLALTCHSTGNFSNAKFGGNDRQVSIPYPGLQKRYLQILKENQASNENNAILSDFEIVIEATHHGPTALSKPTIFIEIGTSTKQWENKQLCNLVAGLVDKTIRQDIPNYPVGICFGGNHYSKTFTNEILYGKYALGTVIPKHALAYLDSELFTHILERNNMASAALIDMKGLGSHKQKVFDLIEKTNLEIIKL